MGSMSKPSLAKVYAASVTDDDLRIFNEAVQRGLEWMWGDAGIPGLQRFAKYNVLRWERLEPATCHEWASLLSRQAAGRPVNTRVPGASKTKRFFESAQAAARWVEDCAELLDPVNEMEIRGAQDPRSCFPEYWVNKGNPENFKDAILLPKDQFGPFQELLLATYAPITTRDRPCPARPQCEDARRRPAGGCRCSRNDGHPGLPRKYEVCQVLRIEDSALWKDYLARHYQIRQRRFGESNTIPTEPAFTSAITSVEPQSFAPQDKGTSEIYLFHGTNVRSALRIASEKVRLDLSKTEGGLGPGFYLAESVTKADEYASDTRPGEDEPDDYYAGVFAMLVMRVTMGKMYHSDHFFSNKGEKAQVMSQILEKREFDSVLGDRRKTAGTFREFCVYDKNQVYTEYVILYERVYADVKFGYASFAVLRGSGDAKFHFQVPPYWNNFSKNPAEERFDEETQLRRRGDVFVQRMLRWTLGVEDLDMSQTTRLENSDMLREYLQAKRQIRDDLEEKCMIPPRERAWELVMPDEKLDEFEAEGQVCGFSLQHFDHDINEVFLWAPVELTANNELPGIREAADRAKQSCALFTNARDVLETCRPTAEKEHGILLCRAVCGQLAIGSTATGADSEATDLGSGRWRVRLQGGSQIYPEIYARFRVP